MKSRIISGVIMAILILGLGALGSYPLYAMIMLCSVIGYMELTAILCPPPGARKRKEIRNWNSVPDLLAMPGLILSVVYYAGLMYIEWNYGAVNLPALVNKADFWAMMLLALDFLLTMAVYVYTFPRRRSAQATGAVTAFLYGPVLLSYVCRTRALPYGIFLYLLIYVCSSVSDVCALAAGMAIGRHKLAPVLSPKKTVEGAVGGVLGSTAVSCLVALLLRRFYPGLDALVLFGMIGVFGSIISQTGDLAASAIKRNHGIKDYGNLIPGHGGIMDRFDSVIFTAPVIYYLSFLLMNRL
ncbi:MAG: phosphatidate cytidylyltransferase [Lachnospiraceae bacterium]|nr:phosphatidate cytidylyltransferase [Lachnospiraceae bacterium]